MFLDTLTEMATKIHWTPLRASQLFICSSRRIEHSYCRLHHVCERGVKLSVYCIVFVFNPRYLAVGTFHVSLPVCFKQSKCLMGTVTLLIVFCISTFQKIFYKYDATSCVVMSMNYFITCLRTLVNVHFSIKSSITTPLVSSLTCISSFLYHSYHYYCL